MSEYGFLHPLRSPRGALLATLRYVCRCESVRFDWLDAAGALVLAADVSGPGATRLQDAAGRDIPSAELPSADAPEGEPATAAIRSLGSSAVMRSCRVAGYPTWVVDDYGNQSRHLIFGCTPDLFLHVHRDAPGTVTVTERTREHAVLRWIRRDAAGALLADEVLVQPGEQIADVAGRCGVAIDKLLAADATLADRSRLAGIRVRLA